jgi:uncharacterized delta-60 repeat protein
VKAQLAWLACASALNLFAAQSSILDISFDPGTGAQNGLVESVLPQPDGKVLISGNFSSFNGDPTRAYIVRLNFDGSIDPSFRAQVGYWVRHMALQPNGQIVVGGFFTSIAGKTVNRIARLNPDGSLDASFQSGRGCEGKVVPADPTNPFVFQVAVQPDGKILATGNFETYNGSRVMGIVRLNTDGSLDSSFKSGTGLDSWGRSITLLPNAQILLSGWFQNYDNKPANRLVLLNSDGSPQLSFRPFFGDKTAIYHTARSHDGKVIAAGHSINEQGLFLRQVAKLNHDGSFDTSWIGRTSDKTESILVQEDGRIVVGGYFRTANGVPRKMLARFHPDGSLDDTLQADIDNFIWTLAPGPHGTAYISGGFNTVDGVSRRGIARIHLIPTDPNVPPVPKILSIQKNNSTYAVTLLSKPGFKYSLWQGSTLGSRWFSIDTVDGTGGLITLTDRSPTTAIRFYRVLVQ